MISKPKGRTKVCVCERESRRSEIFSARVTYFSFTVFFLFFVIAFAVSSWKTHVKSLLHFSHRHHSLSTQIFREKEKEIENKKERDIVNRSLLEICLYTTIKLIIKYIINYSLEFIYFINYKFLNLYYILIFNF